ncbi:MAG TPA: 2-octaprenyl-6-methoxyphenyl hydroxylase [Gammaproteobacteria bacterium]|nr:2-octaprenyl-6-methoxyphenyl hydroxylase [Gammaproteobacteria bacterium]
MTDYDIIIIGAGMVGASLACALRGQAFRIGLIEAVPFSNDAQPSYDARTTALSYGTKRIFDGMGLWEQLNGKVTPIKKIHISDQGHCGFTRLDAAEQGCEAYGYVVENYSLGKVFADNINTLPNVELLCPARVEDVTIDAESARVTVQLGEAERCTYTTRLVVLADGRKSPVRERLGIQASHWSYGQSAVIANISAARAHGNVAYERFTRQGPLALLPMSDNRCAVVWTLRDDNLDSVMGLGDSGFLHALQTQFGWRLGKLLQVGKRYSYPLALMRSHELVRPRLALIGSAAHTLHPVAGQGFNLGLRDVAVFAQVLVSAGQEGLEPGHIAVLERYAQWRQRDHQHVTTFTDALVHVFSNDVAPLVAARNIGLVLADILPLFKDALVRQGMGLAGRQPRLARGLPL